jgi:hypothetical protein
MAMMTIPKLSIDAMVHAPSPDRNQANVLSRVGRMT